MPIGYHVSKTGHPSMAAALELAAENLADFGIGPKAAQIFVTGPQNWKAIELDAAKCRSVVDRHNLSLVVHGSYVDAPWNSINAVHNIRAEMRIASAIGATGVIIHLGSNTNETLEDVLTAVFKGLITNVTLWLEINSAKASERTFETPEKLGALFARVAAWQEVEGPLPSVGLCIDTAHLFACGVALRSFDDANEWLAALPAVPIMMHLNDSSSMLGSGRDIHERLLYGNLWGDYREDNKTPAAIEHSGLMAILQWAEANDIALILERNPADVASDLRVVRDLGFFREK